MQTARVQALQGIRDPYSNKRLPSIRPRVIDLSGGFFEDGPYGPVKLTKSNALSTAMLAWALLDAPDAFDDNPALLVRLHAASMPSYTTYLQSSLQSRAVCSHLVVHRITSARSHL